MKTRSFPFFAMLIVAMASVFACAKKMQEVTVIENVDLVNGIPPRWDISAIDARAVATLDSLTKLPAAARHAYLIKAWPNLASDVTAWLSKQGRLNATVDSTIFTFGSETNLVADDANNVRHRGYYTDQLVANIYVDGSKDPQKVMVRCLNGTFQLYDGPNVQRLGRSPKPQRFTIARGEGLINHVSYSTAMMLAERHNLSMYKGKRQIHRNEITVARARELEPLTNAVQVTVRVFPGDVFDLGAGTYTPAKKSGVRKAKK